MVTGSCPRLVIAATGSGVGKTSLALGLARALARRGLVVQTFKVGPDFLDPTYLAMASGRTCYNLDAWMTPADYVARLFARATAGADLALIEGVMGLFCGATPDGLEGSTAAIALTLDAPVLLAVNAHGAGRSLAATVHGFTHFEPRLRLAGVIANQSGSTGHRALLAESLRAAGLPPLVGAVPRDALPKLENRHLGLVAADQSGITPTVIDQLADAMEQYVDLDAIVALALAHARTTDESVGNALCGVPDAGSATSCSFRNATEGVPYSGRPAAFRVGVARDEAFHFYYPDNLESLAQQGAELVAFSPLADSAIPEDLDILYFGGGYPEVYAPRLAANRPMCDAVRDFAASGRCVYAECGGLMYLGRTLRTIDGQTHEMAGILPVDSWMMSRLCHLGYVEVALQNDGLWGPAGWKCRGHEFHYSEIAAVGSSAGWQPAYALSRPRAGAHRNEGFARGNVLASYVHLHWASRPESVQFFLNRCRVGRAQRAPP
jgi:cobyrinic acid a,c-diamide synthase